MSQTKTTDRRRTVITQYVGIVLTAYAVLMLAAVVFWVSRKGYVDFPCEATLGPRPEVTESTRIVYCISAWPREMYGGGVYAVGASDEDQIVLGPRASWPRSLAVERRGQELLIDGQLLPPGQIYARFRWFPSSNPWLLATSRLTVWYLPSADVISISGSVREGWFPNPLGLLILGIGLWLLVRGRREHRQARRGSGRNEPLG